ncbi:MAG: tetratricopeptide repeat protein [Bacteroidetes bacterium]|nr:tetratricopeptide repeat protein [Bacteroidota bacterium]
MKPPLLNYKNRGNLYLLLGYHELAIEDYTNAILLDENFAEAFYNRALAHFQIYNTTADCFDLEKSFVLGYNSAADVRKYFCVD